MGAYIIHFDDKPWQDLDDEQYYRCKEIPWFFTTKTTISRLTPYTEPDMEQVRKEAYEQGISYGRMCEREKIFKTIEKFSDGNTDIDCLTMGDFRTIMELSKHLQKMKETECSV